MADTLEERLVLDQGSDSFEWYGTEDELIKFINTVLEVNKGEHGELTSDKKHKAISYKVKGRFVRFYSSTGKLVLNSTIQTSLKERFLKTRRAMPPPSSETQGQIVGQRRRLDCFYSICSQGLFSPLLLFSPPLPPPPSFPLAQSFPPAPRSAPGSPRMRRHKLIALLWLMRPEKRAHQKNRHPPCH